MKDLAKKVFVVSALASGVVGLFAVGVVVVFLLYNEIAVPLWGLKAITFPEATGGLFGLLFFLWLFFGSSTAHKD
ncbi:MAG: hypothetical protein AAB605_02920 [Patescibacteria group bacterium]